MQTPAELPSYRVHAGSGTSGKPVGIHCEAGMFCARGDRAVLGQLRDELQGFIDDPERLAQLIREAETSGFQFDD